VAQLIARVSHILDKDVTRVPFADFGGVWWNPAEAGSGFFLDQRANHRLVLAWYTYDDTGRPLWLVGQGEWQDASRWGGLLYESGYQGEGALGQGVDPQRVETRTFGNIDIEFLDAGRARLTLDAGMLQREILIERFPF